METLILTDGDIYNGDTVSNKNIIRIFHKMEKELPIVIEDGIFSRYSNDTVDFWNVIGRAVSILLYENGICAKVELLDMAKSQAYKELQLGVHYGIRLLPNDRLITYPIMAAPFEHDMPKIMKGLKKAGLLKVPAEV